MDIVRHLTSNGEDPARSALEALAPEGYRTRALSEEQIGRLLGYETRIDRPRRDFACLVREGGHACRCPCGTPPVADTLKVRIRDLVEDA